MTFGENSHVFSRYQLVASAPSPGFVACYLCVHSRGATQQDCKIAFNHRQIKPVIDFLKQQGMAKVDHQSFALNGALGESIVTAAQRLQRQFPEDTVAGEILFDMSPKMVVFFITKKELQLPWQPKVKIERGEPAQVTAPRTDLKLKQVIVLKHSRTTSADADEVNEVLQSLITSNKTDEILATVQARWDKDEFDIESNHIYGIDDETIDSQINDAFPDDQYFRKTAYTFLLDARRFRVYFFFAQNAH